MTEIIKPPSKGDKKNIMNRRKPKSPQKMNLTEVDGRDTFQTPNYATKLLIPYIPKDVQVIWECACGEGKMVKVLSSYGYKVFGTDLKQGNNFLEYLGSCKQDVIITNPPFSIKKKFYEMCRKYDKPFALLIPADYSGWIIQATREGCEKIIPTRRVDYITPNILMNICRGETWETHFMDVYDSPKDVPNKKLDHQFLYKDIFHTPSELLRKYSSSYYHSMWLTWGFGLGKSETFVELTNEQKKDM